MVISISLTNILILQTHKILNFSKLDESWNNDRYKDIKGLI